MKVIYKANDTLTFEIDGTDQKDTFKQLGSLQEVFGEKCCGNCNSTNIKFQVRNVQKYTYYEMVCLNCRAKLQYGCHQEQDTIFPKRKLDDGTYSKTKGWEVYKPNTPN